MASLDSGAQLIATGTSASELHCRGDWSVRTIAALERDLAQLRWPERGDTVVDGSGITVLDTSGAWLLHRTVAQRGGAVRLQGFRPEFTALLQLLAARGLPLSAPVTRVPPWLEGVGQRAWAGAVSFLGYLAFVGEVRWRWRPRCGIRAGCAGGRSC